MIPADRSIERAVQLRAEGKTYPEIAAELGVSKTTVRRWVVPGFDERNRQASRLAKKRRTGTCSECGGTTRYNGKPGRAVGTVCDSCARILSRTIDRDELIRLRSRGLSQPEIARRLGCAQAAVSYALIGEGLGVGKGSGPGRGARLNPTPLGCGTNASWARGCRCEPCVEAHRAYYRRYNAMRAAPRSVSVSDRPEAAS